MRTLKKLKKLYWRSSGETLKKLWWNFDETLLKKFQEIFKKKKMKYWNHDTYIWLESLWVQKLPNQHCYKLLHIIEVTTRMQCFKIFTWHVDQTFQQKECFPCLRKQIPNPSKLQLILQTSQEEAENIKSIFTKTLETFRTALHTFVVPFPSRFHSSLHKQIPFFKHPHLLSLFTFPLNVSKGSNLYFVKVIKGLAFARQTCRSFTSNASKVFKTCKFPQHSQGLINVQIFNKICQRIHTHRKFRRTI